jgi:hypothetical protein
MAPPYNSSPDVSVQSNPNEHISTILSEVKSAFERGLSGPAFQGGKFVVRSDVVRIWKERDRFTRLTFQIMRRYSWCSPGVATLLEEKYIKIISTLAYIRWDRWDLFASRFLTHPSSEQSCDDSALPFSDSDWLANPSFLGDYGFEFYNNQWIFIPIVIPFRQTRICRVEERLPFLHDPVPVVRTMKA